MEEGWGRDRVGDEGERIGGKQNERGSRRGGKEEGGANKTSRIRRNKSQQYNGIKNSRFRCDRVGVASAASFEAAPLQAGLAATLYEPRPAQVTSASYFSLSISPFSH